jgi:hypothetical protein
MPCQGIRDAELEMSLLEKVWWSRMMLVGVDLILPICDMNVTTTYLP